MTQVADLMTRGVRTMKPQDSMLLAAQAMEELDVGALPVCDGEEVVGVVTDRDITIRGVAQNRPQDTQLSELMTPHVECVYEDESIDEVNVKMQRAQVRRLPVLDREKHLVGMLSLGDLAAKDDIDQAGATLSAVSEPAAPNREGLSQASGNAGGGADSQRM
jgi:CBS domain-containing protein